MSTIDTTSALGSLLHEHRDQILEIAARHHARNVRVFGSVARGEATATSDIKRRDERIRAEAVDLRGTAAGDHRGVGASDER